MTGIPFHLLEQTTLSTTLRTSTPKKKPSKPTAVALRRARENITPLASHDLYPRIKTPAE